MTDPYTHMNLSEVKDSAAEFGIGDIQEARFGAGDLDAADTGFGYQRVHPGKRQGFAHRHEQAEEVYVVLSGSGRVKLGDDVVELGRLDALRVAPAVTRQFEAGPDGLEMLVFGPRHQGDAEIVQDFWTG
ncbi:MAG: hypothetical protein QOF55_944 [Thermoleophilaceae bacterium]|jgi:mannose-6-phosphate isomerase-like protein (cupin superfamily)|nr:hypothetical protein [Thermoleophilaceae bacterium]